jgi:hypothetical protein
VSIAWLVVRGRSPVDEHDECLLDSIKSDEMG